MLIIKSVDVREKSEVIMSMLVHLAEVRDGYCSIAKSKYKFTKFEQKIDLLTNVVITTARSSQ